MKRSSSHICLALLLVYGMVPVLVGYTVCREWAAESNVLAVLGVLLLLGGAAMVLSAWLLVKQDDQHHALWVGGAASILSSGIFAWVTLTEVLPCSGPA
jgi:hypothetical protein